MGQISLAANPAPKPSGPGPDPHAWPASSLLGIAELVGTDVYNDAAEDLGCIRDIMVDRANGRIGYAVLALDDRLYAVPWRALRLEAELKRFVLNVSRDRLERAPGFDPRHWPDVADPVWEFSI